MTYLGACMVWLILASAAHAAENNLLDAEGVHYAHIAITGFGMLFAIRMADRAFGRRALQLADSPTFPRYMTS